MATEFNTRPYETSHGKAPRGTGCWAFTTDQSDAPMFSPCMPYAEAKRWAKAQAPEARTFNVCP